MSFRLTNCQRRSKAKDVYIRKPLEYSGHMTRKQKYDIIPLGICIHASGTKWDADTEMKYMYSSASNTSFHVLIDSKEIIECGNMNLSTMHVNEYANSYPNLNLISILICESKEYSNEYFTAINNTIEYVSELCCKYGWDTNNIFSHNDFNKNKCCPNLLLNKENPMNWEWFLNTINGRIIQKRKEDKDNTHKPEQFDELIEGYKKEYDIPSFADIGRCELGDVLHKYKNGEIDLKNYWRPGDTKVTSDGCEYVILDIGYDKLINGSSRTVTIMRRDLINLEVSFRSIDGGSYTAGFSKTQLCQEFKRRSDYYVGWFFNNNEFPYNLDVIKDGLKCDVFLLSVEEIFSEDNYAYFKNPKNRKLGNAYLTRTMVGDDFVFCDANGEYNYDHPWNSYGLVPCFVI